MNNENYLSELIKRNEKWSDKISESNPEHFSTLAKQHNPKYLWIGCSDARMPANELLGLLPGEVFVHRNIANLINSSDMNVLSVIEYAVQVLKVRHIIINGHYGCGGIKAAISSEQSQDIIEHWVRPVKKYYRRSEHEIEHLSFNDKCNKISEINVIEQVRNICHIPVVQQAWQEGQKLSVHGLIYNIYNGRLQDLNVTISDNKSAEKFILRKKL